MNKTEFKAMIPVDAPDLSTIFPKLREQDKARAFMQYLFTLRMKLKSNPNFAPKLIRNDGWCPVSSKKMQKLMRDYKPIVDKLLLHGVIEVKLNDSGRAGYHADKYTKLYRPRFTEKIKNAEQVRYRVEKITHPDVVDAIQRVYVEKGYDVKKKIFLSENGWYRKNLEFMEGLFVNISDEDLYKKYPDDYHYLLGAKHAFNDQVTRHISRDEYSGRIASWITSLNKKLRPYLQHRDGEELVRLDVANSQPTFMACLLMYPDKMLQVVPEFRTIRKKLVSCSRSADVGLFHVDCLADNLYNKLMLATGLTRDQVKEQLFHHVMYCPAKDYLVEDDAKKERSKFRENFKLLYKTVYEKIFQLKRMKRKSLPHIAMLVKRMDDVPNILCARLEVQTLINRVTRRFNERGLVCATVNDEWIFYKKDEEVFRQIFSDVFGEIGVRAPKLKAKDMKRTTLISSEEK